MNHGTASGYSNGCRCDDCRQAATARMAAYRARLRAQMDAGREVPHGTVNGYQNYGCRDDECREAAADAARIYRAAQPWPGDHRIEAGLS